MMSQTPWVQVLTPPLSTWYGFGWVTWPLHASVSTTIKRRYKSHWGITKIMPWHTWVVYGKHSINSCYSTAKGVWEQGWETSVSPECYELNRTDHRVPLEALEQRNYWLQPGITQVNLMPAFIQCTNTCDYLQSICIDGEKAWISTEAGRGKCNIKENSGGRNERTLPAKVRSKKEKTWRTLIQLPRHLDAQPHTIFYFFYPLNSQNYSLDKSLEECCIWPWHMRLVQK